MKALLLKAPYQLEMIEQPIPTPGPGEALVKVYSAAICGSEVEAYRGKHFGRKAPVITGHEVCGVVAALGEGVASPAPGTRVVAIPQRSCGHCHWCRSGLPNLCPERLMLGFTAWPGAYQEYFVIPAGLLLPISDVLSHQEAALIEPLAVSVHAVRRLGMKPGESVLVVGSGAIGLFAIMAARAFGASEIIATDISEYNLSLAQALGASHIHNSRNGSLVAPARALTDGIGPHHAILATAVPRALDETIEAVRPRGTIVIVAMFSEPLSLFIQNTQFKEQNLTGSVTYTEEDFRDAIRIAEQNKDVMGKLVTHQFPLEEAEAAFELADKRKENQVRIVFNV